jgi:hypothetical protein
MNGADNMGHPLIALLGPARNQQRTPVADSVWFELASRVWKIRNTNAGQDIVNLA